ncbi:MAG: N-acetylneuraminate synthase family protein [Alphaproteobacteria bacterium]|nr:N-acetylneuraminate synthase family protein [Alphaproteobacteria bacterium]
MSRCFSIKGRKVGLDYAPLVVAEIGINHNGSLQEAFKLVDAAKEAGAEIVKHQTHIPEAEMSSLAKTTIPGNSPYSIWDIMVRCALSEKDEFALKEYTESKGMIFISTPFSFAAIDRLEKMDVPAYKIGSGEMNNYEFVRCIAEKRKPIILSTGMNNMEAVKKAVACIQEYHNDFAILHTTNLYPTKPEQIRLGALEEIRREFPEAIIGLSDHSLNNLACLAATALGASILERHFTDTKERVGEDIICSMTTQECHDLIRDSAEIAKMRGGTKEALKEEEVTIQFAFGTIVATKEIPAGKKLERSDLTTKRPGIRGIRAEELPNLIGKKVKHTIAADEHLMPEDLA